MVSVTRVCDGDKSRDYKITYVNFAKANRKKSESEFSWYNVNWVRCFESKSHEYCYLVIRVLLIKIVRVGRTQNKNYKKYSFYN